MRESLLETRGAVPFNNFTGILNSAGISFPPELGGDCIAQSKHLVRGLREKGVEAKYLQASGSLHVAVLSRVGEELFYLDPFLLQDEAISITRSFNERVAMAGTALPVIGGNPARISVETNDGNVIAVNAARFVSETGRYSSIGRGNLYNTGRAVEELAPGVGWSGGTPPGTLALRVSAGEDVFGIRRETFSRASFSVGRLGHSDYFVESADALAGEAEEMVLEIAQLIKVEASVIFDKLAETSRICMRRSGMRTDGVR